VNEVMSISDGARAPTATYLRPTGPHKQSPKPDQGSQLLGPRRAHNRDKANPDPGNMTWRIRGKGCFFNIRGQRFGVPCHHLASF
jgi:hypothetical protein